MMQFGDLRSPEESAAISVDALFEQLFPLFDRDNSGFADHADVTAALRCAMRTPEEAARVLARVSESGHLDQPRLRELLESCVPPLAKRRGPVGAASAASAPEVSSRHVRLVKFVLAIVKDFEKRTTERGEFVAAAQARDVGRRVRELEQQRSFRMLEDRKRAQRYTLRQGQAGEASEFNEAWTARMGEFNKHAKRAVAVLREQHEAAVQDLVETQRPVLVAHYKQHHRSKEALDAQAVLHRLTQVEEFLEAKRFKKRLEDLTRRDADEAEELAEEELTKKLDVLRWQQKLEVRGLMTKIERIRSEHRGQWEDGLAKLVLAQKTMLSELSCRQHRETRQTASAVRSMLEPSLLPVDRSAHPQRSNLALLSPRASTARADFAGRRGGGVPPPAAPMVRPSRMGKLATAGLSMGPGRFVVSGAASRPLTATSAMVPPSPNVTFPPRPFTSEHVPGAPSPRARMMTPRPLTSEGAF